MKKENFIHMISCLKQNHGGIAQLGEHLPCKQGVKGSNPFISIRYKTIPKEPDKQGSKKYMSCPA